MPFFSNPTIFFLTLLPYHPLISGCSLCNLRLLQHDFQRHLLLQSLSISVLVYISQNWVKSIKSFIHSTSTRNPFIPVSTSTLLNSEAEGINVQARARTFLENLMFRPSIILWKRKRRNGQARAKKFPGNLYADIYDL